MRHFIKNFMFAHWRGLAIFSAVAIVAAIHPEVLPFLAFVGETKSDPQPDKSDPPKDGTPAPDGGNPPKDDTLENIKALQRKLTEKDQAMKTLQSELDKLKGVAPSATGELEKLVGEMREQITGLTTEIETQNLARREKELAEKYPDILPALLLGRSDEEIEKLVAASREKSREVYGDSKHFSQPTYRDAAAVQAEIDAVTKDPKLSGEQKAVRVLGLNRIRAGFNR